MPLKVLYLDDEFALCEIFADYFATDDIIILTFTDSQKAIEASKQENPDVIFVDYRLTDKNGDETAQEMPVHIPKYLITGEVSIQTKYKFNGVFGKPLNYAGIQAVLSASLAR